MATRVARKATRRADRSRAGRSSRSIHPSSKVPRAGTRAGSGGAAPAAKRLRSDDAPVSVLAHHTTMRIAAFMVAIQRVSEVVLLRGVYA